MLVVKALIWFLLLFGTRVFLLEKGKAENFVAVSGAVLLYLCDLNAG